MADTFNTSVGDGRVYGSHPSSFATARSTATDANYTDGSFQEYCTGTMSDVSGVFYVLRGFWPFDISSISASATVTAVTLQLMPISDILNSDSTSFVLFEGTQSSMTSLSTSDYAAFGSTELASRVTMASMSTGTYFTFTLNASGISVVQSALGGSVKFCTRGSQDVDNTAPATNHLNRCNIYCVDTAGVGANQKPLLTVTYTLPGGGGTKTTVLGLMGVGN